MIPRVQTGLGIRDIPIEEVAALSTVVSQDYNRLMQLIADLPEARQSLIVNALANYASSVAQINVVSTARACKALVLMAIGGDSGRPVIQWVMDYLAEGRPSGEELN